MLLFSFAYVLVNLGMDLIYTLSIRGSAIERRVRYRPPPTRNAGPAAPRAARHHGRRSSGAAQSCGFSRAIRRSRSAAAALRGDDLIAIFAPYLGTVDPTALAPASARARPPRHTGSAPTCSAATSIRACSTGRGCRSWSASRSRFLASFAGSRSASSSGFVRWADGVVMRVMDGLMSIPPILLAIALMALTRGSVGNVIMAITVAEIPRVVAAGAQRRAVAARAALYRGCRRLRARACR